MKNDHDNAQRAGYGEIVVKDCYRMNRWSNNFFDNIIDIGASMGIFVQYSHMRHYNAKIFAYEPCKEAFNHMVRDNHYFKNVTYVNEALGDGDDLIFYDTGWYTVNLFFKKNETDMTANSPETYSINSRTLSQIFDMNNINKEDKNFIKIDCEGGERFLIDDDKSIDIIKSSHGASIEIHFQTASEKDKNHERFKVFPKWEIYNEWIYDNFYKTHEIEYAFSCKHRGAGTYNLFKKV
jgi:FkbM family methyltransferase